jgi:phosphohistidine phosphatase SixA
MFLSLFNKAYSPRPLSSASLKTNRSSSRKQQEGGQIKRSLALLILLSATVAVAQTSETAGTVFLVRHAEKVSDAPDALLSKAGEQRATCLAQTLRDAHIGAIYATQVKRTQQTAQPLAKKLGIQPTIVNGDDTAALVTDIKRDMATKNVLVIGHSDTLPKVFSQIGITNPPAIGAHDYDLLFVLSNSNGKPELTTLHYCPSSQQAPPTGTGEMHRMR